MRAVHEGGLIDQPPSGGEIRPLRLMPDELLFCSDGRILMHRDGYLVDTGKVWDRNLDAAIARLSP